MISPPSPAAEPRTYRVGTLVYTRATLIPMMFWMLWGAFSFQILESVPSVIPLQLRWEGASDSVLGLAGSQFAILSFFFFPIIGMQSDRRRGRLGRRRPFLLWCTPPVLLSLVLLGAAKPGGSFLHHALASLGPMKSTAEGCTIAWIFLCYTVFVIFNTYIGQNYQYLIADTVPSEVIGKFYGLFRAIGALGNLAFSRWFFGSARAHTFDVYCLVGLVFASAFLLIVWRVKEGEYPPPPPKKAGGGLTSMKTYCKECFSHPFYLNFYCISFFFWSSLVPLNFVTFFATEAGKPGYAATLGLSLQEFGQIKGWTFLIQIPVFFLIGPLIDRFHPLRVCIVGLLLTSVSYFACFWLIHGSSSLLLWWGVNQAALGIYLGAGAALTPRLLPRERYGQFFSAIQTFGFLPLIVTPPLCGLLLETIRDYRYLFILCGICTTLTFIASLTLYLQWKRLGGDRNFKPPEVAMSTS